jgi:hypothetical protein
VVDVALNGVDTVVHKGPWGEENGPNAAEKNGPNAAEKNGPNAAEKNGPNAAEKNGPNAAEKNGPNAAEKNGPNAAEKNGPNAAAGTDSNHNANNSSNSSNSKNSNSKNSNSNSKNNSSHISTSQEGLADLPIHWSAYPCAGYRPIYNNSLSAYPCAGYSRCGVVAFILSSDCRYTCRLVKTAVPIPRTLSPVNIEDSFQSDPTDRPNGYMDAVVVGFGFQGKGLWLSVDFRERESERIAAVCRSQ